MPMRKKDLKPAQADAIAAGTYVKREKPLELPSETLPVLFHAHLI